MDELRAVLLASAQKYPLSRPVDFIKLIYQNCFGCGHMVSDRKSCLERILSELDSLTDSVAEAGTMEIGNGYIRIDIALIRQGVITAEELADIFISSAVPALTPDDGKSVAEYEKKLSLLKAMTAEGLLSISPSRLELALQRHRESGYCAVSHSELYRQSYKPAYRIVKKEYFNYR